MKSSLRIGTVMGIPLGINYTWLVVFALVTVSLAMSYFPEVYPAWPTETYWVVGVIASLLFFASVIVHELSHGAVALRYGIPVKSITLFIFGGVAQVSKEAPSASIELLVALAGPLSSVAIAFFFGFIWWATGDLNEQVSALAGWLAAINGSLALFNLVPGFPLDGGRVLRSLLWWATGDLRRATLTASLVGRGVAYLFIFGGLLWAITGNWISGLWIAFIGWFLDNAAEGSYRQVAVREALQDITAADLMTTDCVVVPRRMTLRELVWEHILRSGQRCFVVAEEGLLAGIVTVHNIREVDQARWDTTSIGEVMTPRAHLKTVHPQDSVETVLTQMDQDGVNQLPVVDGERLLGMIRRDSVLSYVRTRAELRV